jgi:hypothetical protein
MDILVLINKIKSDQKVQTEAQRGKIEHIFEEMKDSVKESEKNKTE